MITKANKNIENFDTFCKIFTYNDEFVKNYGYIKLNLPNKFKLPIIINRWNKKKFCTLMAGNKESKELGELYSARLKTIRFFEEYYPESFEFYGIGWDRKIFRGNIFKRVVNHIPCIPYIFAERHPCYKGSVNKKIATLSNYKYCICYENCNTISGYITEKIFDCFFSGCIPVYWGAPNIEKHIPADCFIDRRHFATDNEMIQYLFSIEETSYNIYLKNISYFLASEQGYVFSSEYYVKKIIDELQVI
jgi:hypothetical protein